MTNPPEYPTPDQLDALVDELYLTPEMECWAIGTIQEYRIVARTLAGLNNERLKKDAAQ